MKVLVLGATGATGRLVVGELLKRGEQVCGIVRSPDSLPAELRGHEKLQLISGSVLSMSEADLRQALEGCDAVICCLGHRLSFRGMFLPPWRLVRDSLRRVCEEIAATTTEKPVRVILMNSSGCRNRDLSEPVSLMHHVVLGILRMLVPPHADNEAAGNYLRRKVGREHAKMEWVAVRPDSLMDADTVTPVDVVASPVRDALFDAGKISRINVAHFMVSLAVEDAPWQQWKGQMPVLYNRN